MSDWRKRAVCRSEDPELFFPVGTSGPAVLQVEQAKAVCRRCSVSDDCLKWALDTGQDAGVWGGMSEEERRAIQRRGGFLGLKLAAEQFPAVAELEAEAEIPPPPPPRRCKDCRGEFVPTMRWQRLCLRCGAHHPDRTVRRRYVGVASSC